MKRIVFASTFAATLVVGLLAESRLDVGRASEPGAGRPSEPGVGRPFQGRQNTPDEVAAASAGCLTCHTKTDEPSMHATGTVQLGCTDCHGGNAKATTIDGGHPKPRLQTWPASANPVRAY